MYVPWTSQLVKCKQIEYFTFSKLTGKLILKFNVVLKINEQLASKAKINIQALNFSKFAEYLFHMVKQRQKK